MESAPFRYGLGSRTSQGVQIMEAAIHNPNTNNNNKYKQTQVDVIEVVEDDEDGDDEVLIINKKVVVNKVTKGKSKINLTYDNNWAHGVKFTDGQKPAVYTAGSVISKSLLSSSRKRKDNEIEYSWQQPVESLKNPAGNSGLIPPHQRSSKRKMAEDEPEILKKFRLFKRFDIVQDCSDHHFIRQGSNSMQAPQKWSTTIQAPQKWSKTIQAPQKWSKTIQNQWKILEKDLPDTIFVRVYEERMDLMRAVIVGAAGTPYHDGLFFFDVLFPSNYPNSPPQVYYYSHGQRLNPNLYENGKVCLSLLNTWSGVKNEKWIPGKSTMLQVLLSIQALVLNAKPYFNEPGFASTAGTPAGEKYSQSYNEKTFILSCKTMLHTLKSPPKHFKDFVDGYFRSRALAILVACKAYTDGAQVGCLVEGGVQDVDEGQTSCSPGFKTQVQSIIVSLVKAFKKNGATGCEQFLPPKAAKAKPEQRINNFPTINLLPMLYNGHGSCLVLIVVGLCCGLLIAVSLHRFRFGLNGKMEHLTTHLLSDLKSMKKF